MNTGYWLPQGSILHEKYSIKKGLGQGGFAITYLAYDTMLQQNVAIKEYFPVRYAKRLSSHLSNVGNENSLTEEMVSFQLSATSMVYPQPGQEENYLKGMQNFLGEARLLFGKFDIEGIVFIKDFFEENGTAYIVMEYVTGMTLREYEKKKGKISEAEAYKLLLPIVKAISYLHSMGIIHCDISPDNLIFCQKNHLKLIDFGAAKLKGYQKGQKYIMEEQKRENKEELQQETAEEKNSGQGNPSTRSSLLWIFAGGYLVYTGYRLCASVISGAEDSGVVFLAAGGIFVVIGAVLLIMAIRNLAKAGAQKHELEEAAAKKASENAAQNPEISEKKKMSIAERAHLTENLDDAPDEKDEK